MSRDKNLVWIDLEMTGLDARTDVILEIASIITDSNLNVVAYGPELVIHQPEEKLAQMNTFVKNLHSTSGLTEQVRASQVSTADAAAQTIAFVKEHCDKETALLAGNSVWQDRTFLSAYMPALVDHLYYRIIDVSTIKELVLRWHPAHPEYEKKDTHRALEDIKESIAELQHYRKQFFV